MRDVVFVENGQTRWPGYTHVCDVEPLQQYLARVLRGGQQHPLPSGGCSPHGGFSQMIEKILLESRTTQW
jgi:hypothetical protein